MAGLTLKIKDGDVIRVGSLVLRIRRHRQNMSRVNIQAPKEVIIELLDDTDVAKTLEAIDGDAIDALGERRG